MAIKKGTPWAHHNGIQDQSARTPLPEGIDVPQHVALVYVQTERGPLRPHMVSGDELSRTYGRNSFEQSSKFYSHQTAAAEICNGNANLVMIKRVVGQDASIASLRFSLEIGEDLFYPYVRNADGSVVVTGGIKTRATTGDQVAGRICRWVVEKVPSGTFGTATLSTGAAYGNAGTPSTIYPVFDMEINSHGSYGNNVGTRLWFPHDLTSEPGDITTMERVEEAIYRAQFVERPTATGAPQVQKTKKAEFYVDFAKSRGVISDTKIVYDFERLITEYQDMEDGFQPVYGPIGRAHMYEAHHTTLTSLLATIEDAANGDLIEAVPANFINIMNAIDQDGHDYYGFYMDSTGVSLNSSTTHYFIGGEDGEVSEEVLDELVAIEITSNFDNVDYPLVDQFQFPFSCFYDTGFSNATKEAILGMLGLRDDISVAVCTQDLALPENSASAERSMAISLRVTARLNPESILYGTPAVRVVIVGQVGTWKGAVHPRRMPCILDLIHKRSKYMGAANGKMVPEDQYDEYPNNRLSIITKPTHTYKSKSERDLDWVSGVNTARYANINETYWPAWQSVYDDDTSILNSELNMLIAVDIKKMQNLLWTELTGLTKLTDEQFIDRSNERFVELVAGRYDDRVSIVSNTYLTAADEARGYSWTHDAAMYGNTMKTAATLNIIARRTTDLNA